MMAASSPSPTSPTLLVPPPLATPLPPSSLAPTQSQPNASSNPPTPSNSSNPSSPPPQSPHSTPSAPPPPVATSPPSPLLPTSPPPASPPLPSLPSSPPASPPPPPLRSPPPVSAPPPPLRSPRPVSGPPPPFSASPPPPTLSPPPAPIISQPPSSPPLKVSPSPSSSPLVAPPPPPVVISPPPSSNSPPSPLVKAPENSPPPPSLPSPAPSGPKLAPPPSPNSLPNPSPSPPTNHSQPISPLPSNSSPPVTPVTPPFSSSSVPPQNLSPPISPTQTNSSNPNTDDNIGLGNSTTSGSGRINTGSAVAIGFIVGFVVLTLIGVAVWCVRKKNKKVAGFSDGYIIPTPLGSSPKSDTSNSKPPSSAHLLGNRSSGSGFPYSPPEPSGLGNSRSWFTYEQLLEVTNGFSEYNRLGEGGFGSVYKGCLPDGREVAVKQLKVGGSQGEREFSAEVKIISRIHHRHLVSLVGYCISENQRLLVYDYVPNNTLYHHLHGEGSPVMDWKTRLKVAAGAARGIAYLHEDCHPHIIHRDIKSSNILLDNNFEAQVSDFGLAKLSLDSFTHVTTRVMGTFGYMAPEYASSGKLTDKSDVYSFGVVLLELITGRKSVDASQPLGDESLVEWARPLLTRTLDNEDFEGLVDPRLEKNYVGNEMVRMIEAAAACVRHSAAKRPRMGQVVRVLELIADSDLNNGMKPGQSKLFDSAQQSAEIRLFQRMAFGSQDYTIDFSQTNETGWRDEREL